MKLDLVNAAPLSIMRVQFGLVMMGQPRVFQHLRTGQIGAQRDERSSIQRWRQNAQGVLQGCVGRVQVVPDPGLGLVVDLVGRGHGMLLAAPG